MTSIQIPSRYVNVKFFCEKYFDHNFVIDITCYYLEIYQNISIYQFWIFILQLQNNFHFSLLVI